MSHITSISLSNYIIIDEIYMKSTKLKLNFSLNKFLLWLIKHVFSKYHFPDSTQQLDGHKTSTHWLLQYKGHTGGFGVVLFLSLTFSWFTSTSAFGCNVTGLVTVTIFLGFAVEIGFCVADGPAKANIEENGNFIQLTLHYTFSI